MELHVAVWFRTQHISVGEDFAKDTDPTDEADS